MNGGSHDDKLEIRRSARRRKSISVHREGDLYVVSAPMWMSQADIEQHARALVRRLRQRETPKMSDGDLLTRALWLRLEFLPEAPEPTSVRWAKQSRQWGSCTSVDRSIRVSEQLEQAPQYVVDAVIVHELGHLLRADHGPEFKALIARYPENSRADAFLAGMSFSKGLPVDY